MLGNVVFWAAMATGLAVWATLHAVRRRRQLRSDAAIFPLVRWPLRLTKANDESDLPADLLEIAAGLQAGLDFDGAVAPLAGREPWSVYAAKQRAGMPAPLAASDAFGQLWPELTTMLTVHWRNGGPLADMLLLMADHVVRERQLLAELRARTSEAQAAAVLVAGMGPVLAVYMLVRQPHLLTPLLTSPAGALALLAAGALWIAGLLMVRGLLRRLRGRSV